MKHLKFKIGQEHNIVLNALSILKVEGKEPIYYCRIKATIGSLTFTTESNYSHSQLQSFLSSVSKMIEVLKGKCTLKPHKSGRADIFVSVDKKGHILTEIKGSKYIFKCPENSEWNAEASFSCYSDKYLKVMHAGTFKI